MSKSVSDFTLMVKLTAQALGFDAVGISPAEPVLNARFLREWLDKHYHGDMRWLADSYDTRVDPLRYFPECKSVISLGLNYYTADESAVINLDTMRVSKYALGRDYHKVLKEKLQQFLRVLRDADPTVAGKVCVDTSPVMDKYWAVRGGIGWTGKHSVVINPEIGTWMFLGELLINKTLDYDSPIPEQCGECRLCIDACPTGAIVEPYVVDARKCISYLTIECRNDEHFFRYKEHIRPWIYGCDMCQLVCPKNLQKQRKTNIPEFQPALNADGLNRLIASDITSDIYMKIVKSSAMRRMRYHQFLRNSNRKNS